MLAVRVLRRVLSSLNVSALGVYPLLFFLCSGGTTSVIVSITACCSVIHSLLRFMSGSGGRVSACRRCASVLWCGYAGWYLPRGHVDTTPLSAALSAASLPESSCCKWLYTCSRRSPGPFNSIAAKPGTPIKYNLKYNDRYLFSEAVSKPPLLRHLTEYAEFNPLNVSAEEYQKDQCAKILPGRAGINASQATLQAHELSQLSGKQCWVTIDLNKGERVNSRGLQLEMEGEFSENGAGTNNVVQYVWLHIAKYAKLKDGILDCYYL